MESGGPCAIVYWHECEIHEPATALRALPLSDIFSEAGKPLVEGMVCQARWGTAFYPCIVVLIAERVDYEGLTKTFLTSYKTVKALEERGKDLLAKLTEKNGMVRSEHHSYPRASNGKFTKKPRDFPLRDSPEEDSHIYPSPRNGNAKSLVDKRRDSMAQFSRSKKRTRSSEEPATRTNSARANGSTKRSSRPTTASSRRRSPTPDQPPRDMRQSKRNSKSDGANFLIDNLRKPSINPVMTEQSPSDIQEISPIPLPRKNQKSKTKSRQQQQQQQQRSPGKVESQSTSKKKKRPRLDNTMATMLENLPRITTGMVVNGENLDELMLSVSHEDDWKKVLQHIILKLFLLHELASQSISENAAKKSTHGFLDPSRLSIAFALLKRHCDENGLRFPEMFSLVGVLTGLKRKALKLSDNPEGLTLRYQQDENEDAVDNEDEE